MNPPAFARRSFLASLGAAARGTAGGTDAAKYRTRYKYGSLVLAASGDADSFDSRSVDCPFVCRREGQFYMAYVGFDGAGYQTGLASSPDLVHWRKLGCMLKRDPRSPLIRHNVATNWIVRDNALRSPGELKRSAAASSASTMPTPTPDTRPARRSSACRGATTCCTGISATPACARRTAPAGSAAPGHQQLRHVAVQEHQNQRGVPTAVPRRILQYVQSRAVRRCQCQHQLVRIRRHRQPAESATQCSTLGYACCFDGRRPELSWRRPIAPPELRGFREVVTRDGK